MCESFPRLQFVATSHSPFIVQSVSPGGVINLDKETDTPETPSEQSIAEGAEFELVILLAQESGFWSVWMAVFSGYPEVRERLESSFPGTRR